jgi:SpoVK/Ycf46/Vps4 family AAA+-type ATPase
VIELAMPTKSSLVELTPPLAEQRTLPLKAWALELARRWNGGSYSLFILHGNIHDVFPIAEKDEIAYVSLNTFLAKRIFPRRDFLLFFDIGDGLTFRDSDMQAEFFKWLELFDEVEKTDYHVKGPPKDFNKLAPLLRRFFLAAAKENKSATLVIEYPEKIVPASESYLSPEERTAVVTLLKWASSPEMRRSDVGVLLVTEAVARISEDITKNPHVAQIRIELPKEDDRLAFLASGTLKSVVDGKPAKDWSDFTLEALAAQLAGLNLVRIQHLIAEAVRNNAKVTFEHIANCKKRLIEEFCQGLVRFKNPVPGLSLDSVATHTWAKKKLRDIAWLVKNGKKDVIEKGILIPGRVGVGKSFLVLCFASDCGIPVVELAEFRSKWVGDTEIQLARVLMTLEAMGPVVVTVDEADAVFGGREASSDDSGLSSRVFATLAAHIGDGSIRGREIWVAMTSRPDLLAIDMKRQGRFGLVCPLFPTQTPEEVEELFTVVAKSQKLKLAKEIVNFIRKQLGTRPVTGSDAEAILSRARESAVLAKRDNDVRVEDLREAVENFIDPLDQRLLEFQDLAAVLACSNKHFLPPRYLDNREALTMRFNELRLSYGR